METYKTDDSFFMCIKTPFSYVGVNEIKSWFQSVPARNARLIIDQELDMDHANLEQRLDWYPGIRTIGVVMNPWARARLAYLHICNNETSLSRLGSLDFNQFVSYMETIKIDTDYDKWYHPLTPQIKWLEHNGVTADYIFKAESLEQEFQVIQNYFLTQDKIIWYDEIPEYKSYYSENSIKVVEKIFAEDIERFNYTF